MVSKKDILILILVLIGCSAIFLTNNNKNRTEIKNNQPNPVQSNENSQNQQIIIDFKNNSDKPNQEYSFNNLSAQESSKEENNILSNEYLYLKTEQEPKTTDISEIEIPLSLETILEEVNNLAQDIKFKINNQQNEDCPACNQSNQDNICAVVLAVGAGACNCGTLGCTPPHGPWCANPCCCVCCPVCCR